MLRWLYRTVMEAVFGRRPSGEAHSRALHAASDATVRAERARLARLRPIIARLPKRQDWDELHRERLEDIR